MKVYFSALAIVLLKQQLAAGFSPPLHYGRRLPLYAGTSINGEEGSGKKVARELTQDAVDKQDQHFRAANAPRRALNSDDGISSELQRNVNGEVKTSSTHHTLGKSVEGVTENDTVGDDERIRAATLDRNGKSKDNKASSSFPVFNAFFASPVKETSPVALKPESSNGQVDPRVDDTDEPNGESALETSASSEGDDNAAFKEATLVESSNEVNGPVANGTLSALTMNGPEDVEVEISDAESALNVPQSLADTETDVNGKSDVDEEERRRRFIEYNNTNMDQLREDVEKAKLKSMEAKERVAAMEQRVELLQAELDFAEDELQHYHAIKEEESDSITARVDELEGLIQAKADRKRQAEEKVEAAAKESRDKLLKEIEDGRYALRQAKEELNYEMEVMAQLQARLVRAEEQAKAEKDDFDRYEADMLAEIETQKSKVADAETRMRKETEEFEDERINLGKTLQKQITALAETNARFQLEQSLFSAKQLEVQREIDDITDKLRATDNAMKTEKERSVEEIRELMNLANELRQRLGEATEKLESQQRIAQKTKEDLQMRCVFDKVKAQNLAAELNSQKELHQREIKELENSSAQNRAELAKANAMLQNARARFQKDISSLESQVAESKRLRKVKAKQMAQRYRDIRSEMTSLWQGERRKAKQEQKELVEKYTAQLSSLRWEVPRLESEVMEARQLTEDLRVQTDEIMRERDVLMEEGRRSETRYILKKQERNIAISALENEIDDLKGDLLQRNEKLATYNTSLRVLFGLSVKLTRQRLSSARKRLMGRIRKA